MSEDELQRLCDKEYLKRTNLDPNYLYIYRETLQYHSIKLGFLFDYFFHLLGFSFIVSKLSLFLSKFGIK